MNSATETTEQENIAVVTRGFEAYARGDYATVEAVFADNASWSVIPAGVLPGPHHKTRGEVLAYLALIHQETQGTIVATPVAIAASGHKVFVEMTLRAQRKGQLMESDQVAIFTVEAGKIKKVQQHFADFPTYARFYK